MAEYIELTEELILAMRAGAKAIYNTKKYHGTVLVVDAFSDNPKEMPYLNAADILYAVTETKPAADVAPVRHGRWELTGADKRGRGGNWKCTGRDGCGKSYPYKCDFCPNCGAKMDLKMGYPG